MYATQSEDFLASFPKNEVLAHDFTSDLDFAVDVQRGLQNQPRCIPSKYLYDRQGVELFEKIMHSPSFYQTRAELQILNQHALDIARRMGPYAELVELGAGSLHLVRRLIDGMDQPLHYIPVDISGHQLQACASGMQHDYPELKITPIVADYTSHLDLPNRHPQAGRRFGLMAGSAISSLNVDEARRLLKKLAHELRGGALLLSIDLVRQNETLMQVYNDESGLMAAFNLNILNRCNRELGGDFVLSQFRHCAQYHLLHHHLELHLISRCHQIVKIGWGHRLQKIADLNSDFNINIDENIKTDLNINLSEDNHVIHHLNLENQFKYKAIEHNVTVPTTIELQAGDSIMTMQNYQFNQEGLNTLAQSTGFTLGPSWQDPQNQVSLCWLHAPL